MKKRLYIKQDMIQYCFMLFSLAVFVACNSEEYDEIIEEVKSQTNVPAKKKAESNEQSHSENNEQNLLINGGVEEWYYITYPYDIPEGWFCHNNTNVKKNSDIVFEGNYSAKMQSQETGSTARIDQRVSVIPNHKIRIRFHYYVEKWKSKGARTYCYFRTDAAEQYNIPADELEAFYGKEKYYIIRGGGYGLTYFPHDLNVWYDFDETIEVPPTANYFVFGINSYYGTTIYVDDCWVMDIMEPVATSINPVTI